MRYLLPMFQDGGLCIFAAKEHLRIDFLIDFIVLDMFNNVNDGYSFIYF